MKLLQYALLQWFLFFLIGFGLGYPTLNRYDPRIVGGTSDSRSYYEIITRGPREVAEHHRYRLLIPSIAKPISEWAGGRLKSWDPVFFGLLVINASFCATTASLLVDAGNRVTGFSPVGLLAALLYLLNFTVSNGHLSGLVDSGEGCLMMGLVWALLSNRWWPLPLLGFLGALAKETFVPLSAAFAVVWWLVSNDRLPRGFSRMGWILAMAVTGFVTVAFVQSMVSGSLVWPWRLIIPGKGEGSLWARFLACLVSRPFGYIFVWLLPLGIWRLGRLPRPWVSASIAATLVALGLGVYHGSGGNVARGMFNVSGPLLSLSAAHLLSSLSSGCLKG